MAYLKRKIDKVLNDWYEGNDEMPALLVGIRQCGKTESVREFAKAHKLELVELNFWIDRTLGDEFEKSIDVNTLISNIALRFPNNSFDPKKTLLFFDEIQECPRARLSLKNFGQDKRYKVIASGSYLGINGYISGDATPVPVGYESIMQMKTMDFEEFLWALGYKDEHIAMLEDAFERKAPVSESVHGVFKNLFQKYLCIGGFPRVVKKYIETKNIASAYKELDSVVFEMKADFGRRKAKNGEPFFKPAEVARIQNVFDLIPTFLSKENKRFVVSKIEDGGTFEKKDAIEYLKQAHIVHKVHNINVPSLPLIGEKIFSQFKLFPEDIGIVTSMYGINTVAAINKGELGQNKGALYEALVFDSLNKAGIDTYYFSKNSGLKVDFVISYKGYPTLIEAKARTGNAKSSKTILKHPEHYGQVKLIKIGDYNVSEEGDITTIPHYMTFLLGRYKYNF